MNKILLTFLAFGLFVTTAQAQRPDGAQPQQEVTITGNVIDQETKESLECNHNIL